MMLSSQYTDRVVSLELSRVEKARLVTLVKPKEKISALQRYFGVTLDVVVDLPHRFTQRLKYVPFISQLLASAVYF